MDKELNWDTLKEDEGKFALGFILAKELESQALSRESEIVAHVGASITIDLFGNLKIGPFSPTLPVEMVNYKDEDKIKILLEHKIPEDQIIKLLTSENK